MADSTKVEGEGTAPQAAEVNIMQLWYRYPGRLLGFSAHSISEIAVCDRA